MVQLAGLMYEGRLEVISYKVFSLRQSLSWKQLDERMKMIHARLVERGADDRLVDLPDALDVFLDILDFDPITADFYLVVDPTEKLDALPRQPPCGISGTKSTEAIR
jgi:hypothetical protein